MADSVMHMVSGLASAEIKDRTSANPQNEQTNKKPV
jgi:hypothetical protein